MKKRGAGKPIFKDEKRQAALDGLLRKMNRQSGFPAISRYITEINVKASPSSLSSAIQLGRLISKDYSLSMRLLKLVNSAFYGVFSGQVKSFGRAVVVLGFEQVRLTASGLIFMDHMQDREQAGELQREVLAAFISGVIARDLARQMKLTEADDIFTCAMFHNMGKLLAIYYFPEEYRRILRLQVEEKLQVKAASRRTLGLTFNEFGIGVGTSWNLPEMIIDHMREPSPALLKEKNCKKKDRLLLLNAFANELCELCLNNGPVERKKALPRLLDRYRHAVPLTEKKVVATVERAIETAKEYADVVRINRHQRSMLEEMSLRPKPAAEPEDAGPVPDLELAGFEVADSGDSPAAVSAAPLSTAQQQWLMNGMQEMTALMMDEPTLDEVLAKVVDIVYHGLDFELVLFCISDAGHRSMRARYGLGPYLDEVIRKFRFPLDRESQDIFNMALAEARDIYIDDTARPEVKAKLPDWYKGILVTSSFVLFPVTVKEVTIGMLYAAYREKGRSVSPEQLRYLKMLRNQVVLAIRQESSG